MEPPVDLFALYIDGQSAAQLPGTPGFVDIPIGVGPGPHRIDMSYQYIASNSSELPPSSSDRLRAVWIDNVSIESLALAPPTEIAQAGPESEVRFFALLELFMSPPVVERQFFSLLFLR